MKLKVGLMFIDEPEINGDELYGSITILGETTLTFVWEYSLKPNTIYRKDFEDNIKYNHWKIISPIENDFNKWLAKE